MCSPAPRLTPRERQIVLLVVLGKKRSAIAAVIGVHIKTVDFHLVNARRKLGVFSLVEIAVWGARANGELSGATDHSPPRKE